MRPSEKFIEAVYDTIGRHADPCGLVNMKSLRRDLDNLPLDPVVIQDIIDHLESCGVIWHWGKQMVVVRPVLCPKCGHWVHERLTEHMHEEHPRPTVELALVEWE